jgi:tRNA A-37 threonylcarbamoyl transferase component Bud32
LSDTGQREHTSTEPEPEPGAREPRSAATAATAPLEGDRLGQRYLLIGELGRGGMGIVFKAFDEQLRRVVALKLIRPDRLAQASVVERFRRESAILRGIQHPNVCPVLDAGEIGDTLYISLEYLEGPTLQSLLERSGPLPTEEVLRFGEQLASALEAIHREGVVHRDIKPHNVIVSGQRAFLMDFGVASHPAFHDLTAAGRTPGSLSYFSPEQANGQAVGPPSDVFALGLVLYEMCTGRRAPGDDVGAPLAFRGPRARLRRPSSLAPSVPPEVDAIVQRCLRYSPRQRFASAAAVGAALVQARARLENRDPADQVPARALPLLVALGVLLSGALLLAPPGKRLLLPPLRRAEGAIQGHVQLSPSAEDGLCRVSSRLDAALRVHLADGVGHIPQAWTAAQALFALDPAPLDREQWRGFLFSQRVGQEPLWRKYPLAHYPTHLAASAWVFMALAHLETPAEPAALEAFLAEQQPQGAWPIYAGARAGESASTYATATALLALQAQRGLREGPLDHALDGASARATSYLLAARLPGHARWTDYPGGQVQRGISGLALDALHHGPHPALAEIDRRWLDELPAEPAGPRDFESSNRTIRGSDGHPLQSDDTRYYELPWCLLATLDAYPAGSPWQRARALRWIERALRGPDPAAEIVGDDSDAWIAAELLLAFRNVASAARATCSSP